MLLIVGLGNPGRKYKKTRHNVGWRVIDVLKKEISDKNVILFKPQTFMNQSGKAVKKKIENCKLERAKPPQAYENLYVIHDDTDLPFGTIRVSKNISSAGHKGVQSIIDELGTQNFSRVRIGIRLPSLRQGFGRQADKFVLEKFTKQEEKQLKEIIKEAVSKLKQLLYPHTRKSRLSGEG